MPTLDQRLADYEAELRRLSEHAVKVEARDLASIRAQFAQLSRDVMRSLPNSYVLNERVALTVLSDLALELDGLVKSLGVSIKGGMTAQAELAQEMMRVYRRIVQPDLNLFYKVSPGQFHAAIDYSARLIGWADGGLARRIQAQVDRALRLSMIGVQSGQQAQNAISAALGLGDRWTYEAERIFRTETHRFGSYVLDAEAAEVARANDGHLWKRWRWSHISREEHARIDGQQQKFDGWFRVPRKATKGPAVVYIAHPHAATDKNGRLVPGDVTINCGCYHTFAPAKIAGQPAVPVTRAASSRRR